MKWRKPSDLKHVDDLDYEPTSTTNLPNERTKGLMALSQHAVAAAKARLIQEHRGEYDAYLREERVARGLKPLTTAQILGGKHAPTRRHFGRRA